MDIFGQTNPAEAVKEFAIWFWTCTDGTITPNAHSDDEAPVQPKPKKAKCNLVLWYLQILTGWYKLSLIKLLLLGYSLWFVAFRWWSWWSEKCWFNISLLCSKSWPRWRTDNDNCGKGHWFCKWWQHEWLTVLFLIYIDYIFIAKLQAMAAKLAAYDSSHDNTIAARLDSWRSTKKMRWDVGSGCSGTGSRLW